MNKDIVISNIDKIHTTNMGIDRIKRNLNLTNVDAVEYCINVIKDTDSNIIKKGKNYYCILNDIIITINSYSYTIITAKRGIK